MMYWFGGDVGGWGYALMIVSMLVFWGLIIAGFVLVLNGGREDSRVGPVLPPSPEQLLAERFARGEIDEVEYRDRQATLREGVRS